MLACCTFIHTYGLGVLPRAYSPWCVCHQWLLLMLHCDASDNKHNPARALREHASQLPSSTVNPHCRCSSPTKAMSAGRVHNTHTLTGQQEQWTNICALLAPAAGKAGKSTSSSDTP